MKGLWTIFGPLGSCLAPVPQGGDQTDQPSTGANEQDAQLYQQPERAGGKASGAAFPCLPAVAAAAWVVCGDDSLEPVRPSPSFTTLVENPCTAWSFPTLASSWAAPDDASLPPWMPPSRHSHSFPSMQPQRPSAHHQSRTPPPTPSAAAELPQGRTGPAPRPSLLGAEAIKTGWLPPPPPDTAQHEEVFLGAVGGRTVVLLGAAGDEAEVLLGTVGDREEQLERSSSPYSRISSGCDDHPQAEEDGGRRVQDHPQLLSRRRPVTCSRAQSAPGQMHTSGWRAAESTGGADVPVAAAAAAEPATATAGSPDIPSTESSMADCAVETLVTAAEARAGEAAATAAVAGGDEDGACHADASRHPSVECSPALVLDNLLFQACSDDLDCALAADAELYAACARDRAAVASDSASSALSGRRHNDVLASAAPLGVGDGPCSADALSSAASSCCGRESRASAGGRLQGPGRRGSFGALGAACALALMYGAAAPPAASTAAASVTAKQRPASADSLSGAAPAASGAIGAGRDQDIDRDSPLGREQALTSPKRAKEPTSASPGAKECSRRIPVWHATPMAWP